MDHNPRGVPKSRKLLDLKVSAGIFHIEDWDRFVQLIERPSIEEAATIFETTTKHPPTEPCPYLIGYFDYDKLAPLDPGPAITCKQYLGDIHACYHHIATTSRVAAEDMTYRENVDGKTISPGLRSYNEVYFGIGFRLWLKIAEHHLTKFDNWLQKTWSEYANKCNRRLDHQNLMIPPSVLSFNDISFKITVIGIGEAEWMEL